MEDGRPAHRLHVVGADNPAYLPQILQQQVQDLRRPLPLVVAELLQLTQLSLGGCQCRLEKAIQPQVSKVAEFPTCSLQSSTAQARLGSLIIHPSALSEGEPRTPTNRCSALGSLTGELNMEILSCKTRYVFADNIHVSKVRY